MTTQTANQVPTIQIESYRTVKELLESAVQNNLLSPRMMTRAAECKGDWKAYNRLLIAFLDDIYVNGWFSEMYGQECYYEIEEYAYQDLTRFFESHANGTSDEYFNSCTILVSY